MATKAQVSNGDDPNNDWAQGYGFQFWMARHNVYRGDGAFGQFCLVLPEHNAVVAITSGDSDLQGVLDRVWQYLLPCFNHPASDARLKDTLSHLVLSPRNPSVKPLSEIDYQDENGLKIATAGDKVFLTSGSQIDLTLDKWTPIAYNFRPRGRKTRLRPSLLALPDRVADQSGRPNQPSLHLVHRPALRRDRKSRDFRPRDIALAPLIIRTGAVNQKCPDM